MAKSTFSRLYQSLNIQADDLVYLKYLFPLNLVVGFAFIFTLTISEALFLSRFEETLFGLQGIEALPMFYILGAIFTIFIGSARIYLQSHFSDKNIILVTLFMMAGTPFAIYLLLVSGSQGYIFASLLIWAEIIYFLIPLNYELTANKLLDSRMGKRIIPIANIGTTASHIAGSFLLSATVALVGLEVFILLAAIFMIFAMIIFIRISHHFESIFSNQSKLVHNTKIIQKNLKRNHNMSLIWILGGIYCISSFIFYFVEFQFKAISKLTFSEENLAIFFGLFNGFVGLIRLALQMFVVNRLLSRLGLFLAQSLLPLSVCLLSILAIWLDTTYIVILIIAVKSIDYIFRYTINDTVQPLLYQCLPGPRRTAIQSFINSVIWPVSAIIASLALISLPSFASINTSSLLTLSYPVVLFCIVFITLIYLLKSRYHETLLLRIRKSPFDFDPSLIGFNAAREALSDFLSSTDEHKIIYAINSLQPPLNRDIERHLERIIQTKSISVRIETIRKARQIKSPVLRPYIGPFLNFNSHPDILYESILYYADLYGGEDVEKLLPFVDSPYDKVKQAAIGSLYSNRKMRSDVEPILSRLSQSVNNNDIILFLSIVRYHLLKEYSGEVIRFLKHDNEDIIHAAILTSNSLYLVESTPILLTLLDNGIHISAISNALISHTPDNIETIYQYVQKNISNEKKLSHIISILGSSTCKPSYKLLEIIYFNSNATSGRKALSALFHRKYLFNNDEYFFSRVFNIRLAALKSFSSMHSQCSRNHKILHNAIKQEIQEEVHSLFQALAIKYNYDDIHHALRIKKQDDTLATDIIESVTDTKIWQQISPFLHPPTVSLEESPLDVFADRIHRENPSLMTDWVLLSLALACTEESCQLKWRKLIAEVSHPYKTVIENHFQFTSDNMEENMLTPNQRLLLFRKVDLFKTISDSSIAALAAVSHEQYYISDEIIFRENENGDIMFIIATGKINIQSNNQHLHTLLPGECFGEMSLFNSSKRSATAVAVSDTTLLTINAHDLHEVMQHEPEIANGLIDILSTRLRETTKKYLAASNRQEPYEN